MVAGAERFIKKHIKKVGARRLLLRARRFLKRVVVYFSAPKTESYFLTKPPTKTLRELNETPHGFERNPYETPSDSP